MTNSEDRSHYAAPEASKASILPMPGVRSARQGSRSILPPSFQVWGRVRRAFASMLVQRLKTWKPRAQRDVAELHRWDDRRLRAAIRTGTNEHAAPDNAERIAFCPVAGKPEPQTPSEPGPGKRTMRWDERPPQIIM